MACMLSMVVRSEVMKASDDAEGEGLNGAAGDPSSCVSSCARLLSHPAAGTPALPPCLVAVPCRLLLSGLCRTQLRCGLQSLLVVMFS